MCVCLLIDQRRGASEEPAPSPLTMDFFWDVNVYLGPRLSVLSDDIQLFTDQQSQASGGSSQSALMAGANGPLVCYIYFNRMNLATKATFGDKQSKSSVGADIILQLTDIQEDLQKLDSPESFAERLVKNKQDTWLYGRRCRERELYLVLNNKQSTLKDVYETVENLCRDEFANIFFQ
jgi:hypothetical protein